MALFLPKTPLFCRFLQPHYAGLSQTQASLQNLQDTCLSPLAQTSNAIGLGKEFEFGVHKLNGMDTEAYLRQVLIRIA